MKTKGKHIHRGEVLQTVMQKSDLTITQIAKRAGYSRSSYYNHIEDAELSFDIIERYGKAMRYDFTQDFPQMAKYIFDDIPPKRRQPRTFDEAIEDRDYWRDKYITLLERYNQLIEIHKGE